MSRWLLALVLTVASATAWAQPAGSPHEGGPRREEPPALRTRAGGDRSGAGPSMATARAQVETGNLERRVGQLTRSRNLLAKQYADQVAAVERLKKQRTSWRQQRELRDRLAEAQGTATKLSAVTGDLARASTALAAARRTLVTAIETEVAAGAVGPRAAELARLKAQHVQQAPRRNVQRIVLPELEIDPLADPEELDQQVVALRESEAQLQNQIVGLEKQAQELDAVAKLKKQHDRAGDLARRDDDQPQRTALQGTGFRATAAEDQAPAPAENGGGSGGDTLGLGTTGGGGFESEASIVLSEVVDAGTIDMLTRAQRSGDPAQRALAAKKTRDAVAGRLEQLRKKRAEIEALSKARKQRR